MKKTAYCSPSLFLCCCCATAVAAYTEEGFSEKIHHSVKEKRPVLQRTVSLKDELCLLRARRSIQGKPGGLKSGRISLKRKSKG
ncbi:hypothetical protein, partial [Ardenticatena maritima]|uniref:hypothetical protein n=1 Tax=Ardenticatena maritima TaxID=872965 RepID=UPI001F44B350